MKGAAKLRFAQRAIGSCLFSQLTVGTSSFEDRLRLACIVRMHDPAPQINLQTI